MNNKLIFTFFIIIHFVFSQSIDKIFIKANEYDKIMIQEVEPYLNSIKSSRYFKGEENKNIYYQIYKINNPKGGIVISHGFGEFIDKYNELIYYLTKNGYDVYAFEHRGYSRSDRVGQNSQQVQIEDYNYYINDLKKFLDEKVIINHENKLFFFGHSMGAVIGTLFLEKYPKYFEKAVLSAPMFEINLSKRPKFLVKAYSGLKVFLNSGTDFAPGESPYSSEYNFLNSNTTSKERYDYGYKKIINNSSFQNGGASIKWLNEALKMTKEINKKKNIYKIKTRILVFQAGNDIWVNLDAQNNFVNNALNAKLIKFSEAKHEIYRENDSILLEYMNELLEFYNN